MTEKVRCEDCDRNFPNMDALAMHNADKHTTYNRPSKEKNLFTNKNIMIIGVIAIILIMGYLIFFNPLGNSTGNVVNDNNNNNLQNNKVNINSQTNGDVGEVQKITLSMKGNYYPNTITVRSRIPVEITLDSSVGGCYRSFNIPELGVSKSSRSPSDTIKFTPDKKGTFRFQCGMNMGSGKIIVE